jgi:predicted NAD-dependent protein-ADP-ribosyltransferase YbiA (DUF1768 family)
MPEMPGGEAVAADKGVRLIARPDGSVVQIGPDGVTVIERPDGSRLTQFPDGMVRIERADGTVEERPRRERVRPEAKPLNVASGSPEAIGRLMSNFAHTPFTLDGRWYASVEGFYQSLKFEKPTLRSAVRRLYGAAAKHAGRVGSDTVMTYNGKRFEKGDATHLALVKRAIRAKLVQHPEIARAFVATAPRPIVHVTGRRARPGRGSGFTDEMFCRILTELRDEFARALGGE